MKMETESSVVVIEAPSTIDDHHWPNSGFGGQLSAPYEMDRSDSWKERIHFVMSKLQDRLRTTGFKACLQLKQKKKLLTNSCLEVILLSSVTIIIWIIFTTPTIVFALSSATVTNEVILHIGWVS